MIARSFAVLGTVAALTLGFVLAAPLTASAQPFQQATEVIAPSNAAPNPVAGLDGVSCTSPGNCVGVGQYFAGTTTGLAMAAAETGGTWVQATEVVAPSTALPDPVASLQSISCTSPGNCVAVGSYNVVGPHSRAMAATETNGTWGQATQVTAPSDLGPTQNAFFKGVSCTSVGNCVATGAYGDTSGNLQAMEATETGGTWGQATKVTAPSTAGTDPLAQLVSISCTSAGNCVAVGQFEDGSGNLQAMEATETSGTFGQASEVMAPSGVGSPIDVFLLGISCAAAGNCAAVGYFQDGSGHLQPMDVVETGGTFGQAKAVPVPSNANPDPHSWLSGISCTSAGNCIAVGLYTDGSGNGQAMEAVETSGNFGQATEVTAPSTAGSDPIAGLNAVSCPSAGGCVAVGGYVDTSSNAQAMATNEAFNTPPANAGYWLVGSDGGVFTFGSHSFWGSMGGKPLNASVVGMAPTADRNGYWLVAKDGGVFAFGDAHFWGSEGSTPLNAPVVGMASTGSGNGYWLDATDGGVFAFGDAKSYGSMGGKPLNAPIVAMAASPTGKGYWLVASDGGIFNFGDAGFFGSQGGKPLNAPITGIATTPDGMGYWLVAKDGGVFAFGDAAFSGSEGGKPLNKPMVGMAGTVDVQGYWLDASDGGIFTFGDAQFFGSMGGKLLNAPMVSMAN